ncbi:MAG: hypothetical protein RLZZ385_2362 [Pseudomonadota bacterium]|jgi:NADH-quinone oxidoreductase subunit G
MAKITIDGVSYEVKAGSNLLQECLSLGLDVPYFCWHPCMGSVGACRQCAVKQYKDENDKNGMLVMACMTPVTDGALLSVDDAQARDFRANVIESLMINHPHDCPVCEEGGECHLQDMTLMSGHNYRRYDKKKRTHRNQYLGPFIGHEMNRCIACYRCVRYYNDYAGGTDLAAQASHHHVYFGRHEDGVLESEFSGNLVEVCPTGVFTDATFSAHYTRKWDLQTAPSVCSGCSVGCNTTPGERYGSLRRIVNRYHGDINGYFLCDRGRFGYGFVNDQERFKQPFERIDGQALMLDVEQARERLQALAADNCIGIGSPRAGVEANFALRQLVGEDNFYAGCDDTELAMLRTIARLQRNPGLHCPTVREIEQADCVVIIGEDVTNTAPRLALALRQSVRNRARELAEAARIPVWQDAAVRELAQDEKSPLFILAGHGTRLDDVATDVLLGGPATLQQLACAIAGQLDAGAPGDPGKLAEGSRIGAIAGALLAARRPLIVTGSGCGNLQLLNSAANVALALYNRRLADGKPAAVDFCAAVPEVNSLGMVRLLKDGGQALGDALARMTEGKARHAIVLENDLYRRAPAAAVDQALAAVDKLAVIDLLPTATTDRAFMVLAGTSFAEQEAVYVNYEGRAQLSFQVFPARVGNLPAWQWLQAADSTVGFNELVQRCAGTVAALNGLSAVLPDADHYPGGMKVPRQSHRYSGRTAMQANLRVNEPKQPQDPQSLLAFSMEGVSILKDSSVLPASWAPRWNSNQSISKFQDEVAGQLRQGSAGVVLRQADSASGGKLSYLPVSAPLTVEKGRFAVVEAFHIFGSDELSARAAPVRERSPRAYAALCPQDAEGLGLQRGHGLRLEEGDTGLTLPVVVRNKVTPGTVVVYGGPARQGRYALPAAVSLSSAGPMDAALANLIVSDRLDEEVMP